MLLNKYLAIYWILIEELNKMFLTREYSPRLILFNGVGVKSTDETRKKVCYTFRLNECSNKIFETTHLTPHDAIVELLCGDSFFGGFYEFIENSDDQVYISPHIKNIIPIVNLMWTLLNSPEFDKYDSGDHTDFYELRVKQFDLSNSKEFSSEEKILYSLMNIDRSPGNRKWHLSRKCEKYIVNLTFNFYKIKLEDFRDEIFDMEESLGEYYSELAGLRVSLHLDQYFSLFEPNRKKMYILYSIDGNEILDIVHTSNPITARRLIINNFFEENSKENERLERAPLENKCIHHAERLRHDHLKSLIKSIKDIAEGDIREIECNTVVKIR